MSLVSNRPVWQYLQDWVTKFSTRSVIREFEDKVGEVRSSMSIVERELAEIKNVFSNGGKLYYAQLEAFPLSDERTVFYASGEKAIARRVPSAPGFEGLTFEMTVEKGGYYKSHVHPDCWEVVVPYDGEFACDGKILPPFNRLVIAPGNPHDLVNVSDITARAMVYFLHKGSSQVSFLLNFNN